MEFIHRDALLSGVIHTGKAVLGTVNMNTKPLLCDSVKFLKRRSMHSALSFFQKGNSLTWHPKMAQAPSCYSTQCLKYKAAIDCIKDK